MSDSADPVMSDKERSALFENWLKPLTPVRQTRNTTVAKIAPWRKDFVAAQKAGFSWSQLAKDVATKREIGVKVTGRTLMEYVIEAYKQAGEPLELATVKRRRRGRAGDVTAQKIASRTPATATPPAAAGA